MSGGMSLFSTGMASLAVQPNLPNTTAYDPEHCTTDGKRVALLAQNVTNTVILWGEGLGGSSTPSAVSNGVP